MNKSHDVELDDAQRRFLLKIIKTGHNKAYRIRRASILLKADKKGLNLTDREISQECHCHLQTVYNTRKRFVESGLEYTLGRKPRSNSPITPEDSS